MKSTIATDSLKKALNTTAPALSTRDFIPSFKCFCFLEDSVYAYDDLVSIRYNEKTGIKGVVRGDMVLGVVNSLPAGEVEVQQEAEKVTLKSGKVKLDFVVTPVEDFVFTWPTITNQMISVELTEDVVSALRKCLESCAFDTSSPAICGVTLYPDGNAGITANSTDRATITTVALDDVHIVGPIILPIDFCKAITQSCKAVFDGEEKQLAPYGKIYFDQAGTFAVATLGPVSVFSRLYSIEAIDYPKVVGDNFGDDDTFIVLPQSVNEMLVRAQSLVAGKNGSCRMIVQDGELILNSVSDFGQLQDDVPLEAPHPDIEVFIEPEKVRKFLTAGKQQFISIKEKAILLQTDNCMNLISTLNK